MKQSGYFRLLLMDERKTRKHLNSLWKNIFRLSNPYTFKTVRDYLRERKHLKNIEDEIKTITDAAFFRYQHPLCIEDILNENHHGNSTPKQIPGDRNRSSGESKI